MDDPSSTAVAEFFAGHSRAALVFASIRSMAAAAGPCEVRVSRSQVALRRRRGFAYVWMPGRWLKNSSAEVVLSIALGRSDPSPRFKEVAHPAPEVWMHHLEVHSVADLDGEVAAWLDEAYRAAG